MLRAVALAARLDFALDPPVVEAIRLLRHEIARSSPPRLLEEYYKILRSGYAEKTFRGLAQVGLLEPISTELHEGADEPLWRSLAEVDAYRRQFESSPETFTNTVLLGSLLVPLGFSAGPTRRAPSDDVAALGPRLGDLPLARRDVERLTQVLGLQRRIREIDASPRVKRALTHRSVFREALAWFEIHGNAPEIAAHWRAILAEPASDPLAAADLEAEPPVFRRRRRRRRRSRPVPQ
jgi:poly(A) polymerase